MAIALDTTAKGSTAAVGIGTAGLSYTVGVGGILVAVITWNSTASAATGNITGVTYNTVAMTQAVAVAGGAWGCAIYVLTTPAISTVANIVATSGNANVSQIDVYGLSYTGCSATNPDSHGSISTTNTGGTLSVPDTVGASGCWLVSGYAGSDDAVPTGNNLTRRQTARQQTAVGDTNGTVGTGSQNAIWNSTDSGGNIIGAVIAIAPPVSVNGNFLAFM